METAPPVYAKQSEDDGSRSGAALSSAGRLAASRVLARRVVALDYGHVLGGDGITRQGILEYLGVPATRLTAEANELINELQRGGFRQEQVFWDRFCPVVGARRVNLSTEQSPWLSGFDRLYARYQGSTEILRKIREADAFIILVSNVEPPKANRAERERNYHGTDLQIISCRVNCRKGDGAAIYSRVAQFASQALGRPVTLGEMFFADNKSPYVREASEAGVGHTFRFDREQNESYAPLEEALRRFGLNLNGAA